MFLTFENFKNNYFYKHRGMQYVFELHKRKSLKAKLIPEQINFPYQSSVLFSSVFQIIYLFANTSEVNFNTWNWFLLKCSTVCKFEPPSFYRQAPYMAIPSFISFFRTSRLWQQFFFTISPQWYMGHKNKLTTESYFFMFQRLQNNVILFFHKKHLYGTPRWHLIRNNNTLVY